MSTKILIIDHNDSFTYNLVQLFEQMKDIAVSVKSVSNLVEDDGFLADAIILSPGPGLPQDYPETKKFLNAHYLTKPVMGVCLGLQHIVQFFGGELYKQQEPMHGRQIKLNIIADDVLFKDLKAPIKVGLYHSWAASRELLPDCLQISAVSEKNTIMSVQHKTLPIAGIQYHPESYMTTYGKKMMRNWIDGFKK